MNMNNKFNPLFFQASLAAGGISLMPFNFLQFAIPHGKGLIKLSDIVWTGLSGTQMVLYAALISIMFVSIAAHVFLTFAFLKGLIGWLSNKGAVADLMGDPYKNMTIFPIIGSLAMSANVLWAPIGFFVPQISSGLQSLMLPSLAFWGVLWIMMFVLEFNVAKTWLKHKIEIDKFNFVWLLDVFAFGLVSLAGSGVAGTSGNPQISGIAVIGTLVTVAVGILLLSAKLINLIKPMIKGKDLPAVPILPAYFILVPITCLFGISIFRLTSYFQKVYSYDLSSLLSVIVVLAYVFSMTWLVFTVYLLGNYFKNLFKRSEYSAPQWSMVCALVGSQVLGVYAHSLYIKSPILYAINFISIIMAAAIYIFIFMKFMKVLSPVSNSAS
jgi:hypothetical protein